eukprot:8278556-Alexandrium_andersonii.AAC.1
MGRNNHRLTRPSGQSSPSCPKPSLGGRSPNSPNGPAMHEGQWLGGKGRVTRREGAVLAEGHKARDLGQ